VDRRTLGDGRTQMGAHLRSRVVREPPFRRERGEPHVADGQGRRDRKRARTSRGRADEKAKRRK
jgi:hypothetical protein